MEYDVVEANGPERLSGAVASRIKEGWRPQGGVCAFYTLAGYFYLQAVIRIKEV